jgi:alkyldihydroxyacetonephosphate synthase
MECSPPSNINHEFLQIIDNEKCYSRRSFAKWDRITHSHGASLKEIMQLRVGKFERTVDVVVYPISTEQCERIVSLANDHNVMLVPFGGGTNVTQALMLKSMENEKRMIVSIDMGRMNKVMWIDRDNMIACVQAGIRGQDMERDLKANGVICGHEPDSMEFSTLGGWISTRASGMKKNTYGNIEDIINGITLVTPSGTYRQTDTWPRISAGPDFRHMIMGQEGNFGIITDAIIRIRPAPKANRFNALVFPSFEIGTKFMEEMARGN